MGTAVTGVEIARENKPLDFVAQSPCWVKIMQLMGRVARAKSPVLILGETGVGKEIVARRIHEWGPRAGGPFEAINCAAIPHELIENEFFGHDRGAFTGALRNQPGAFERAASGTLFLDEIGEMPQEMQARLLRVLQNFTIRRIGSIREAKVDVRIIMATNRDLKELLEEKLLRRDIYYRMPFIMTVPPLRDRPEDIFPLLQFVLPEILDDLAFQTQLTLRDDGGLEELRSYAWPGNVRELRSLLLRTLAALPESIVELTTSDLAKNLPPPEVSKR